MTAIMRQNMEKVLERDEVLHELEFKSEHMRESASRFQAAATKLKRRFQWANIKQAIVVAGVIIVIVGVVVLIALA